MRAARPMQSSAISTHDTCGEGAHPVNALEWMQCSGQYSGDEAVRLAILKYAAVLGAEYIDVELKAAPYFFLGASP